MRRKDVIKTVYSLTKNVPIIFTTEYACREAFDIEDRVSNFYMVGSMGLAASIGIGIALQKKETPVIVIEGDGSFLMCPNNIYIAGHLNLSNFIHIVIDNNMYESTGDQKTITKNLDLSKMATLSGYKMGKMINELYIFEKEFHEIINANNGPYFFHLVMSKTTPEIPKRVPLSLENINNNFSDFLKKLS